MIQKTPVIVVGNGLTAEVMCSALDYFNLKYTRLLQEIQYSTDARTTTINVASQKMLSRLKLWSSLEDEKTAIKNILVSSNKFKTTCFEGEVDSYSINFSLNKKPMAWTVQNSKLLEICRKQNSKSLSPVEIYNGTLNYLFDNNNVTISDKSGRVWQSDLLIACDGSNSQARKAAGLLTTNMAANQKAIVTRLNLNRFHNHIAFQRFLPDGPIALMPFKTQEAALVWSLSNESADVMYNLSDAEFEKQIINVLGVSFRDTSLCSNRTIWTLKPSVTRSMGQPGLILAGDSNHSIHPLAGMGFNLALADIAVICDCLDSAKKNGLSFSHESIIAEYRTKRRVEVESIIAVTQGLNRLFSYNSFQSKILPSRLTNIGLGLIDLLPIKKQISYIASGGILTSAKLFSDT